MSQEKMPQSNRGSNASPSAYGWCFQVGAGICLMLDNIKDIKAIKMEGKDEDIELFLNDGSKIYAQAKSVTVIGDQRSARENLKKSLHTLFNASENNKDICKLIYISNIIDPISSSTPSAFELGRVYEYSVLSEDDKAKLQQLADDNFTFDKFEVHTINFFGEGENKFENVKAKIKEFLANSLLDPSYVARLWKAWFTQFMINCSDIPDSDKQLSLTKEEVIMPLIVIFVEEPISHNRFSDVSDSDLYEELLSQYRIVMDSASYNYEFASGILGDFESIGAPGGHGVELFVKNNWRKYAQQFDYISDEEEREELTKLVMLSIIDRRRTIKKIKVGSNL